MYSPNFTLDDKIFCLSLHYNSDNSYLFVNGKEVCKFKAKNSELKKYNLCLGSISKDYDKKNVSDIMFMILVLTVLQLQLTKYMIFTGI